MSAVSAGQIAAIHALKGRAGIDDASYRAMLEQTAGVTSSKALTHGQAGTLIDRLKVLAGQGKGHAKPAATGALNFGGPYAGICRALWISLYQLGEVDHPEDTALLAFVRSQAKVDHISWLRDPRQAASVIEALKSWLARAGVRWPARAEDNASARKLAVIRAQLKRLGEPDAMPPGDFDNVMAELGRRIRSAHKA